MVGTLDTELNVIVPPGIVVPIDADSRRQARSRQLSRPPSSINVVEGDTFGSPLIVNFVPDGHAWVSDGTVNVAGVQVPDAVVRG